MATARFGYLPEYGNAAGAWLAGCVPHRGPGGEAAATAGATAAEVWSAPKPGYLLLGVEPEFDSVYAATAKAALDAAESVVAIAPFTSDAMLQYADIILPGTTFAETDGTFVNAEGLWQNFSAAGTPPGEARANWKILRVLGNELGLAGFDYYAAAEVRRELKELCRDLTLDNTVAAGSTDSAPKMIDGLVRYGDVPMYSVDPLVRRSRPLQEAADAGHPIARVAPGDADRLGISDAERVTVRQGDGGRVLDLLVDARIPEGCVWIPQGLEATGTLGPVFGGVELERA
jgi:NADH-quinone oxidoreductase subunit G